MFKWIILAVIVIGFILSSYTIPSLMPKTPQLPPPNPAEIAYLPIGDSYTIGKGLKEEDRWPNQLTLELKDQGLKIELIGNPAVSGYTTQDAIDHELPVLEKLQPNFVTIQLGANDAYHQVSLETFRKNYQLILDRTTTAIKDKKRVVLITMPDFSLSPFGKQMSGGKQYSDVLQKYNQIIKEEGEKYGLKVIDIFPLSQTMTSADWFVDDGLHPTAALYQKWLELILPIISSQLK